MFGTSSTGLSTVTELVTLPSTTNRTQYGGSPLYCASSFGIGKDNPDDPTDLNELQRSRSIIVEIINTSYFYVVYHIVGCCGTGRKYDLALHCHA